MFARMKESGHRLWALLHKASFEVKHCVVTQSALFPAGSYHVSGGLNHSLRTTTSDL